MSTHQQMLDAAESYQAADVFAQQEAARFVGLLREYLQEAGITQASLADAAGLSHQYVSDLLRGRRKMTSYTTQRLVEGVKKLEAAQP